MWLGVAGGGRNITSNLRVVAAQIFSFVVVRAKLSNNCAVRDMLWSLSSRPSLRGECGYYLTMFEAALEHIKSMAS